MGSGGESYEIGLLVFRSVYFLDHVLLGTNDMSSSRI